jgi:glycerate kinase
MSLSRPQATKVIAAPDKFRGSLTALQAAVAIADGIRAAWPEAQVLRLPLADGGEGTVDSLVQATGGTIIERTVEGPLGQPVTARFGLLGDRDTAVIEMAAASGHAHVPPGQRDPTRTHTRGTGQLILAALELGCRKIILGIGGSATNDGGAGVAAALGYQLLDAAGRPIEPSGGGLAQLDRIDPSGRISALDQVELAVACDVDHPLCGPRGASAVFGPQKGATAAMVQQLDANLAHFAGIIERDLGRSVAHLPGAGAAGGLGAGLVAFAGGKLTRGIDLVLDAIGIDQHFPETAFCLTGEGMIDASSQGGKTIVGLAQRARRFGCPVVALAGALGPGAEDVLQEGVSAIFSISSGPMASSEAMNQAAHLLTRAAEQVVRVFLAGHEVWQRWANSN